MIAIICIVFERLVSTTFLKHLALKTLILLVVFNQVGEEVGVHTLYVLVHVALLVEGEAALLLWTFEGFLIRVDPQMRKELAEVAEGLVA